MEIAAFFCRCCEVISSDVLMNDLLEDRGEIVSDTLLQVGWEVVPDLGGMSGQRASQSSATVRRSVTASRVSLVEASGRDAASGVDARGMRKTRESRYATNTC